MFIIKHFKISPYKYYVVGYSYGHDLKQLKKVSMTNHWAKS